MLWDNTCMCDFFSEYDRFTTEKFCENTFVVPSIIYNCFLEEEGLKLPGFQWIREHQQK